MYPQNSIAAGAITTATAPESGLIKLSGYRDKVVHADDIVDKRPPTLIVSSSSSAATCVTSKYADLSVLLRRVRLEWCCSGLVGVWELLSAHWDSSCTWPPLKWENNPLRIETLLETLSDVARTFQSHFAPASRSCSLHLSRRPNKSSNKRTTVSPHQAWRELHLSQQRVLPLEQMAALTLICSSFTGEYCEMEQRWFPWQRTARLGKCEAQRI